MSVDERDRFTAKQINGQASVAVIVSLASCQLQWLQPRPCCSSGDARLVMSWLSQPSHASLLVSRT